MAKRETERTQEHYPLHRGPFLFAPHFLAVSEWFPEFNRIIERTLSDASAVGTIGKPRDGRQALIKFSVSEMMIDGDGGLFFVDQLGSFEAKDFDDSFWNFWSGPCGAPRQFFEELHDPVNVGKIGADYRAVRAFSNLLYFRMKHRFEKALKCGIAEITARLATPFNDRSVLEPWQLKCMELVKRQRERYFEDDRDLDKAIGQDGTKVFGLGVTLAYGTLAASGVAELAMRPRGRRPSVDRVKLDELMIELIRKRGVPSRKTPRWTNELLVKAVKERMKVGRTTILENLPSVIAALKKERSSAGFRQSGNSKLRVN